jgi:hypothetical protein
MVPWYHQSCLAKAKKAAEKSPVTRSSPINKIPDVNKTRAVWALIPKKRDDINHPLKGVCKKFSFDDPEKKLQLGRYLTKLAKDTKPKNSSIASSSSSNQDA